MKKEIVDLFKCVFILLNKEERKNNKITKSINKIVLLNKLNEIKLYFKIFPVYSISYAYLFLFCFITLIPGLPYALFGKLLYNNGLNLGMVLIGLVTFAIIVTTFFKPAVSATNLLNVVNKKSNKELLYSLDAYQKQLVMSLIITSKIHGLTIEEITNEFDCKRKGIRKVYDLVKNYDISLPVILGSISAFIFGEKKDIFSLIEFIIAMLKELFTNGNAVYTTIILLIFIVLGIALYIILKAIKYSSWSQKVEEAVKCYNSHKKNINDFSNEKIEEKYNIVINNN